MYKCIYYNSINFKSKKKTKKTEQQDKPVTLMSLHVFIIFIKS